MCLIYWEVDKPLIFRILYGLFIVTYKSSSIFILGNRFSPSLLLFYRSFQVFLTIAICIYLCFAGEVVFRFLAFGFISHTTRISNKTSFLCKRLIVKKLNLETISPALQNWNVLHWTFKAREFNLQIILDFGKDLLLNDELNFRPLTSMILLRSLQM